jgi:hypothetical protein
MNNEKDLARWDIFTGALSLFLESDYIYIYGLTFNLEQVDD